MRILILTLAILAMVSFTTSDTNPTSISETYNLANATNLAKEGCESRCGDLIVPYPFGIGINSNCSIGRGFDVYCNDSFSPPKGFFTKTDYVSIKNISDSTIRTSNLVDTKCYYPDGELARYQNISFNLSKYPFSFSDVNKFTVLGCDDYAWLTSKKKSGNVSTGCMVFCSGVYSQDTTNDECAGNGCCQSPIPKDINSYKMQVSPLLNQDGTNSSERCTYAFVGEDKAYKFNDTKNMLNDTFFREKIETNVPIVLDWAIGEMSCEEAKETDDVVCQSNSTCVSSNRESGGYRCECNQGYEGNPYLSPGCQDIDECNDPRKYPCFGYCLNTQGNYTCTCKKGYSGNAKSKDGCQRDKPSQRLLFASLGIGFALLLLLIIGLAMLYIMAKKRKLVKLREKLFEQNGGTLLLDKLKTKGGVGIGAVNIYRIKELEEATDNFAESKILGKGGNGTVYKGTLPDKRVVAIKKSQRVDEGQREEFINEMVILTKINHTHVVQLLGLCLENDVPLLAYEYVSNNTLYHHIHYRKSGASRLSWDSRLRIAYESAGALAYLHTDARMPIIHRDVKSTNILLDENYTAKIADFGASRLVPLGHDLVPTIVQGTFGYLDPDYFHTGQLSDKSDVYSFGVVLAELLTGQNPLNTERDIKERNLATYFVKAMEEDRFLDILECGVVKEATYEQLKAISGLVCRCLNLVGGKRPGMKEVTMELESLRRYGGHSLVREDKYNETSSLMIEMEPSDLYTVPLMANTDTFGDSSITTEMQDMMFPLQSAR